MKCFRKENWMPLFFLGKYSEPLHPPHSIIVWKKTFPYVLYRKVIFQKGFHQISSLIELIVYRKNINKRESKWFIGSKMLKIFFTFFLLLFIIIYLHMYVGGLFKIVLRIIYYNYLGTTKCVYSSSMYCDLGEEKMNLLT